MPIASRGCRWLSDAVGHFLPHIPCMPLPVFANRTSGIQVKLITRFERHPFALLRCTVDSEVGLAEAKLRCCHTLPDQGFEHRQVLRQRDIVCHESSTVFSRYAVPSAWPAAKVQAGRSITTRPPPMRALQRFNPPPLQCNALQCSAMLATLCKACNARTPTAMTKAHESGPRGPVFSAMVCWSRLPTFCPQRS
jgi:hypothetical protein